MKFIKFNNNPLKKLADDCVIRAISEALNKKWYDVFDELNKIARKNCEMINSKTVILTYLKNYDMVTTKTEKGKKRLKVNDFEKKKGTYILRVAGHLTVVKNGVLKDTFNCQDKCVYRYWIINEEWEE